MIFHGASTRLCERLPQVWKGTVMLRGLMTSGMRGSGRGGRRWATARWACRAARRRARGVAAATVAPVLAVAQFVVPVAIVAAAGTVAVSVAHPVRARAASQSVLILSTSVTGGSSSAEAAAVPSGDTVTVVTPSAWDSMTTAQFAAYSAIVIGDPSTSGSCALTPPSDAVSTASTWGAAVTGNVAVVGTAPVFAGSAGTPLLKDGIGYALAGSGTGLYVSLNCEYQNSPASTAVPLLSGVDGGGFTVTGQGPGCPDTGTVNTWEAEANAQFSGLSNSALGGWASPACSVEETLNSWPAGFDGVAYQQGDTPADFTASDGATGQPYVLVGAQITGATASLAPSAGGEVPAGATTGGPNPAAPGVSHATAGDPVDTENGDFTQSATDVSVPTYGPALAFTRTYDAQLAQQQTQTGTPGALGYGWTGNWASSLRTAKPVPGDVYLLDGRRDNNGNGGPPGSAPLDTPQTVYYHAGDVYIVDTAGNRIQEIPGTTGTRWGLAMTAGNEYTVVGDTSGQSGLGGNGSGARSGELNSPGGMTIDSAGNMYVADTDNCRVVEIPAASGTHWGIAMTAGDMYTIAGRGGTSNCTIGNDNKVATQSNLDSPSQVATDAAGDVYIADMANARIQEVAVAGGTQWGQSMTASYVYTVAGSSSGAIGFSGTGGAATSALLYLPQGVAVSAAGNLYLADTGNCRVAEVPKASGTQWGQSMTANDIYTVAGRGGSSNCTIGGDNKVATQSNLKNPTQVETGAGSSEDLYIADSGNNRIQEVARAAATEWGQPMTATYVYTVAGSSTGTSGYSGDGGAATSATMNAPDSASVSATTLYTADTGNNRVRQVNSAGTISGYAGNGYTLAQTGNGGPATDAGLGGPEGVASDAHGDIYVVDSVNGRVQEIAASTHTQWGISMTAGDVYTIAGSASGRSGDAGDGGAATSALLDNPDSVAVDAAGDVYLADYDNCQIREVAATTHTQWGQSMTAGDIYTVAGSAAGTCGNSGDYGPATAALLGLPGGIAVDTSGDLYIADFVNARIQEVAGVTRNQWGQSMTAGDIYTVAGSPNGATGVSGNGGPVGSALLDGPVGVATDPAGDLYIADTENNRVQEAAAVTSIQWGRSMQQGYVYTVAGSPTGGPAAHGVSGDGGRATSALLYDPEGVALDAAGNLYVGDTGNNRIQEVAAANGTQWGTAMTAAHVYTVAGSAAGTLGDSGDGGPATAARADYPGQVAVDPSGDIFFTDSGNNALREVAATATATFPEYPQAGGITVTQGNGAQVTFYPQSGGTCTSPYVAAGGYCALPQYTGATLTYNSTTSTYTFSPSPGTSDTFTWNGVFTAESDAAGDTLTIGYASPVPGSGQCPSSATSCNTITSASGRALVLGLDSGGRVTTVTNPLGRRWGYAYNSAGDLISVTDPMSHVTSYTYGQGSTGNALLANDLLTITGPNAQPGGPSAGDATVNIYDSLGRVTSQTDPAGWKTTFDYGGLNASTGAGTVRVAGPDGNTTVYTYAAGTLIAQSSWTGSALVSEQDYGPDLTAGGTSGGSLLNAWTASGDGGITAYTYDGSGNTTLTTDPLGDRATQESTALDDPSCTGTAEAASDCSASLAGPAPVAPGGVITPPSAAPPPGVSYTLYDTRGNELYTTTGVYQPGASSASYQETSYTLYNGNSVTVDGNHVSCAVPAPAPSLPCATINPDGVATQLSYDSAGDLLSSATPDGNGSQVAETTYSYDADGEQTAVTSPDGNLSGANAANYTVTDTYNSDGQPTAVTKAGGSGATVSARTTNYGYDADGNQTTVQGARGYTTTTSYNADDQATLVTDPSGNASLTCRDGEGNVTQTVPALGVAAGNLTPASCPAAYPSGYGKRLAADSTTYTFDANGDQTAMSAPAPAGQGGPETTTFTFDANGNLVATTDPPSSNAPGAPSQVIRNTYNADDELTSQTTGYGSSAAATISYCYDPNGDQTAAVAPDGNTSGTASCETSSPWVISASAHPTQAAYQTANSFDSAGELVSSTAPATSAAPGGATTTQTYDPSGNVLASTDPIGIKTTWTYTPTDLPASVTYSGSSAHSVTYSYDANGLKTAMTDATGSSSYSYDPFGEVTSAKNGAGQEVGYGYDPDGDTTSITYPLPSSASWAASSSVDYGYSQADVLNSMTDFSGTKITVNLNADSLPSSEALGGTGDTLTTTYDATDTPSSISVASSSATLQSFSYSDAPSRAILTENDTPSTPASPATYSYDGAGRLTSMKPGSGTNLNYGYDASGNLTVLPSGAAGTYDHASELVSSTLSGTTTSYSYNPDGERLGAAQGSTVTAAATWNGAGQVVAYANAAANMSAAAYDGNGLRAAATITPAGGSAATAGFVWNTTTRVPRLLMDSRNAYLYETSGTPAEQVDLSTGKVSYLVSDLLGSVRGIVSSAGALTASTSYDAWGNPAAPGGLSNATPFGYAGGYTDATGLIYLVNRYYDPGTGQFLSVNPEVSVTHVPYGYAYGDPVTLTDPSGLTVAGCTRGSGPTKCRTDELLWHWNSSLGSFLYWRQKSCRPQSACNNHGNSHGRWLDWSSDGCSWSSQNPDGFPFWKACERHDFGHRNYKEQGRCTARFFKNLNNNFYYDMKVNICSHENVLVRWLCYADALTYKKAVDLRGSC